MLGISCRHGVHQVAQKFNKTSFPRNSRSRTGRPSRSGRVKSRASDCSIGRTIPSAANKGSRPGEDGIPEALGRVVSECPVGAASSAGEGWFVEGGGALVEGEGVSSPKCSR